MNIVALLISLIPGLINSVVLDLRGSFPQVSIFYKNADNLFLSIKLLKSNSRLLFSSLIDITAVDWLNFLPINLSIAKSGTRFQLVYNILSYFFNARIRLCVFISSLESVNSVFSLFRSANWLEREVWDMFGIYFYNHPDLRRILTDYGFSGFPLRKDFPLSGYEEVRYDESNKGVVYEPVELSQEMRIFDSLSPWAPIHLDFFNYIN